MSHTDAFRSWKYEVVLLARARLKEVNFRWVSARGLRDLLQSVVGTPDTRRWGQVMQELQDLGVIKADGGFRDPYRKGGWSTKWRVL